MKSQQSARFLRLGPIMAVMVAAVVAIAGLVHLDAANAAVDQVTIWGSGAPSAAAVDADTQSVELGTRFTARADGLATGVRFYKTAENSGEHVGSLWRADGVLLGRVAFSAESESGWQTATFASPMPLTTGESYVVSYLSEKGRYLSTQNFHGASVAQQYLQVPTTDVGVYNYDLSTRFPSQSWHSSQYWVDVTFRPQGPKASLMATPGSSESSTPTMTPSGTTTVTPSGTATVTPSGTTTVTPSGTTVTPSGTTTVTPLGTTTGTPSGTTRVTASTPKTTTQSSTTAASSPQPSGNRVNCAAVPSSCGYPDATNTGVPAGTTLVKVPGERSSGTGWAWSDVYGAIVTTGPGAVMNGLDVDGGVQIMHPDATLSNSKVTACGGYDDGDVVGIRYNTTGYSGSNATVVHNTLNGSPAGCDHRARSGIRDVFGQAPGVTATANDISGTGNGITLEYEGVAADNWIHDLGHIAGDHHSGLSDHGGAKQVVYRHNTVLIYNTPVPGGGGVSAALTVYGDFGHAQNTVLDNNFISGGAYTIFAGSGANDPATNVKVTNNRLVCGQWDYGPVAFFSPLNGNQFSGNYCDQNLAAVTP